MTPRRHEYGDGSVYQRKDGIYVAVIEAGFTATGGRRRIACYGKTKTAAKRKREEKKFALGRGETGGRTTVKMWADTYLEMRVKDLAPKGYSAAASPIRNWVVPAIGKRRLDQLTPADIRAVAAAQTISLKTGRPIKESTKAATHRALMTMLTYAIREGHAVSQQVMKTKGPTADKSDRIGMTVDEGLACMQVASTLDHGARWLVTLIYGLRKGECLGLTWDAVDFDAGEFGEIVIEWQLQALPWVDKTDRSKGFRVPSGYDHRHLVDAWHLVRPKSKQGYRVAPMLEPVRDWLLQWRAIAPENPWGLVWPSVTGRPANEKHDLTEWWAVQGTAAVGHPDGRYYHVHECRNFAATMLSEAGVDEHVITRLLGHSSIVTSRQYMNVRREPLLAAMTAVGERLQLGPGSGSRASRA